MDLSVFSAVASGLANSIQIGKAINELNTDTEVAIRINALVTNLGDVSGKFLAAQTAHIESEEQARELREEIAQMKAFAAESLRYALTELAPGAFCYTLKPECQNGEPLHHLCACCYGQQTKSILQFAGFEKGFRKLSCPRCSSFILVREPLECGVASRPSQSRSMFRGY